uniref:Uncharacterized protein n=1 Tax=Brassica oleracea var. oleracea TaxID=109376 RepID=A0A0D3DN28_BRAOL
MFFDCTFSFELRSRVASRCRLPPFQSWNQTVDQMESLTGDISICLLSLLAWQATIYWLWNEQNGRLHARSLRPVTVIYTAIDHQIRNKIHSFRDVNPSLSSTVMQRWFATA